MRIIIGITGASGSVYALKLIDVLRKQRCEVHAVVSNSGWEVLDYEMNITREVLRQKVDVLHEVNNIGASIASGSFKNDAMIVVPCSMKTLACIANGISDNLLTRAADVILKEGRSLIIVPRETPINAIHLENMLKLAKLGVKILPACPAFYHKPDTIEDLVDMLVGKICDLISVEHDLFKRWEGNGR